VRRPDNRRYELSDTFDRLPCLRHYRGEQMPDMRHARPDFELNPASRSVHPISHSHRVVAQNLIASHLNEGRRKTRRVAVKRGGVRRPRIGAGEVVVDETARLIRAHQRVRGSVLFERETGKREIGPGRHRDGNGWQRNALITQPQQQ